MATTITCNQCQNKIEITEALRADLEGKILAETQIKHQQELRKLQQEKVALLQTKERELEDAKKQITEISRKEAIEKVRQEYDAKIQATKEESIEREEQNKQLQEQAKEYMKKLRTLKDEKDKLDMEYEKKLLDEQDKIKSKAKQEAEEELNLKIAEKDKQLQDVKKANEELRRKLDQGSQQLQGEVQELHLEELLTSTFPFDEIKEIAKGINGADILQVVRTQTGQSCGTIVWESKRTKNWSAGWIQKLKDDQRSAKADLAVLVSNVLPQGIQTFGMVEGVLVTDLPSAIHLAHILRQQLLRIHSVQTANVNKASKAEVVYNYLISNEFKQRIEVWVEYFKMRREQIDKERMYFNKKWESEEKEVLKILQNTAGIYGDLQGLIGNALPKVGYLELPGQLEMAVE